MTTRIRKKIGRSATKKRAYKYSRKRRIIKNDGKKIKNKKEEIVFKVVNPIFKLKGGVSPEKWKIHPLSPYPLENRDDGKIRDFHDKTAARNFYKEHRGQYKILFEDYLLVNNTNCEILFFDSEDELRRHADQNPGTTYKYFNSHLNRCEPINLPIARPLSMQNTSIISIGNAEVHDTRAAHETSATTSVPSGVGNAEVHHTRAAHETSATTPVPSGVGSRNRRRRNNCSNFCFANSASGNDCCCCCECFSECCSNCGKCFFDFCQCEDDSSSSSSSSSSSECDCKGEDCCKCCCCCFLCMS